MKLSAMVRGTRKHIAHYRETVCTHGSLSHCSVTMTITPLFRTVTMVISQRLEPNIMTRQLSFSGGGGADATVANIMVLLNLYCMGLTTTPHHPLCLLTHKHHPCFSALLSLPLIASLAWRKRPYVICVEIQQPPSTDLVWSSRIQTEGCGIHGQA